MGFFGDLWDGISGAPEQIGDLFQGAGEGLGNIGSWLGERSGGPTSNIPDADRNNYITPGGEERANRLNALADQYGNRRAPQAADSSFRADQASLVERLRNQMGGADSLAQLQLRNATDQNIAQQRSMAASAGPQNMAMMQRLAAQNIGKINQGLGQQAAQLGIQERNAAANALAGVAGQARGQDLGLSQFNTGAQLQQTSLNDQAAAQARAQELANAGLRQQGNMGYESNQTTRRGQDLGVPTQPANWERVVGAAGAIAPFFLAKGGVVTRPTNAVVGEAGPEAVIPLDELPSLVERLSAITGGRTKQTAKSTPAPAPAPAPQSASLFARPEELSRARQMMRPEELYRMRPAPRPPLMGPPSGGGMYLHQPRGSR